jgi:dimethylhistidine N-methyltransferase
VIATTHRGLDASLAADVRHYLAQSPRQLPSRALYDALGSALFDAICELPWYPLTRAERRLIVRHREALFRHAAWPTRIVELGPGNGAKLDLLLGEGATAHQHVRRIDLVDVSRSALREAIRRLQENRTAHIVAHEMRYEDGLRAVAQSARPDEKTLILFLGSNIGNFDPPGAAAFLRHIRESLSTGDSLLIGADLVKPVPVLMLAYDDPLGVTAAFNKNLLLHLNTVLGASFDLTTFEHRARWNAAASRVEMHLVSRVEQRIQVPLAGVADTLRAGEAIWTESSYKYRLDQFNELLVDAGLSPNAHWIDEAGQFLLVLAGVNEASAPKRTHLPTSGASAPDLTRRLS